MFKFFFNFIYLCAVAIRSNRDLNKIKTLKINLTYFNEFMRRIGLIWVKFRLSAFPVYFHEEFHMKIYTYRCIILYWLLTFLLIHVNWSQIRKSSLNASLTHIKKGLYFFKRTMKACLIWRNRFLIRFIIPTVKCK